MPNHPGSKENPIVVKFIFQMDQLREQCGSTALAVAELGAVLRKRVYWFHLKERFWFFYRGPTTDRQIAYGRRHGLDKRSRICYNAQHTIRRTPGQRSGAQVTGGQVP